jgi:hypothetical protein
MKQQGWENLGACWSDLGAFWRWNLKSQVVKPEEWTLELHCISKLLLLSLLVFFLTMCSLEFLAEKFLAKCSRETLINEWDTLWIESGDGVHSLG